MKHLLIVYHSQSGGAQQMADAVLRGAERETDVETRMVRALEAGIDDLLWANAVIFGTPENFGYMSGALKDFFDRVFYEIIEDTPGLPYALFVKAGSDGEGAVRSIERLVTGLKWKAIAPPLVVTGKVTPDDLDRCIELGATMAAGLEAGMF